MPPRLWVIRLVALQSHIPCSQLGEQLSSLQQVAHALHDLVYARHLQVEKNDVGCELFECNLDLPRIADGAKLGRRATQEFFQLTNGRRLVMDYQHASTLLAHGRGPVSTAADRLGRSPQKVICRYEFLE